MDVKLFNEKYKDKGGIGKLNEFRALLFTHAYIGEHFGVDKQRAKQWIQELYGENYDPRETRREAIIKSMIDFAKNNSEEMFDEAFCMSNEEYALQAKTEARQRGLFETEQTTQKEQKPHLDHPGEPENSLKQ